MTRSAPAVRADEQCEGEGLGAGLGEHPNQGDIDQKVAVDAARRNRHVQLQLIPHARRIIFAVTTSESGTRVIHAQPIASKKWRERRLWDLLTLISGHFEGFCLNNFWISMPERSLSRQRMDGFNRVAFRRKERSLDIAHPAEAGECWSTSDQTTFQCLHFSHLHLWSAAATMTLKFILSVSGWFSVAVTFDMIWDMIRYEDSLESDNCYYFFLVSEKIDN